MNTCEICEKEKKSLVKCEGCKNYVCEDCCIDPTPTNMIDFPFCKDCHSANEGGL